MWKLVRSRFVVPVLAALAVLALIVTLILHWQDPSRGPSGDGHPTAGSSAETIVPSDGQAGLEAWQRPSTSDPQAYAVAFGRAIWTYDSSVHDLYDWQDAVSAFANPMGEGPRIATSLLPYFSQWQQLELHKAKASVVNVTAVITPELQALEHSSKAPKGWHGFLVRGRQTSVLDDQTTTLERQVTVGIVCLQRCTFWSATTESPT